MNMLEIGVLLKLTDHMTGGMRGVMGSLDGFGNKMDSIAEKSSRMGRASMANGMIMMGLIEKPIKAFADLDEASTNLRVAMMDNLGQIPKQFAEINKQAVELGNLLPGTTADFTNAATALIENGTALDNVIGGGLKAASYLSVILKMPARDAAEMVAKFREAYGLSSSELTKMADLTQKAKFAFGLNPEEIKYAAQYMGASLNALHLTGADNAKQMLAFQGYARQKGMEGSVFGTNFAQMLNQMGQMESKLGRNSKPMREVNEELAKYGVHMQFFTQQGKFVGLENMLGQLEKLRVLSEQERLFITNKLFGMEGGRVASMGIDMGAEGLRKNLTLMDKQADIMQRIDEVTKSAKNTWEAFTGTVTNLMAAFGGPAVDFLKPYITRLNEITGGPLQKFVSEHKTMATVVGVGALAFGVLAIGIGGVALAIGGLARAGSAMGGVFGAGKKGALAGGISSAVPIPVYVVNQPGLLSGAGGAGDIAKAGIGSKLLAWGNKIKVGAALLGGMDLAAIPTLGAGATATAGLAVGAAGAAGYGVGLGLNAVGGYAAKGTRMEGFQTDVIGHSIAQMMALFGNKNAREALALEKISHAKQEINGTIHIRIDSEGRASVASVKSPNLGLSFNPHAGHTMVTS